MALVGGDLDQFGNTCGSELRPSERTDSICFGIFKVGCHICCICRQEVLQTPLQLAMIAGGSQGFYLYVRLVRLSNCTMTQAHNFIKGSWEAILPSYGQIEF